MKTRTFGLGILFVAMATLNACAPVYKCGEDRPTGNLPGGNRLIPLYVSPTWSFDGGHLAFGHGAAAEESRWVRCLHYRP